MGLKTFDRGIHPSYYKELTSSKNIRRAALPKTVTIPLSQHLGAPSAPLVKKGDAVQEGQKIADAQGFVSAPVHSSINGKVKDIELCQHPNGTRAMAIVIDGDGTSAQWPEGFVNEDLGKFTPEAIRDAIREAGIVGMGGAAFPTFVKLTPPKGKTVDTVILNGCECEPFLTADHRIMVEQADKVVWGLKALMKATGASKGVIGIEENKPDAIDAIKKAIGSAPITIVVLEAKYPQGAEKMLIKAAVGRKVPVGKLPLDVGVVVNNVGTAVAIYEALVYKKPLMERVVTISGNGVNEPCNLMVRIGTSFEEVLSQCGGLKHGVETEVLNGGPMMGVAQTTLNVPVLKGTSGITVLTADKIKPLDYGPCIKCTSCVEACPMGLMPYRIGDYGNRLMLAEFKEWDGHACIECGCCSYVCPAKRPLLQWIRQAKFKARVEASRQSSAAAAAAAGKK